jgi:hypothetical protein
MPVKVVDPIWWGETLVPTPAPIWPDPYPPLFVPESLFRELEADAWRYGYAIAKVPMLPVPDAPVIECIDPAEFYGPRP